MEARSCYKLETGTEGFELRKCKLAQYITRFSARATTQFSNMNFTRESKGAYNHESGYVVGERNTVVRYKNSNQVREIGPVSVVEAE